MLGSERLQHKGRYAILTNLHQMFTEIPKTLLSIMEELPNRGNRRQLGGKQRVYSGISLIHAPSIFLEQFQPLYPLKKLEAFRSCVMYPFVDFVSAGRKAHTTMKSA
jgi:hypothetical protein